MESGAGSVTLIALTDIALLLIIGVPILLIYRSWARWVDRLADRLWPFEKPRRFGLRSWAARTFVLNTPADEVRRRLNELTEMEWSETGLESSKAREVLSSGLAALSPLLGVRKVSTGIEVEWLDHQTVELHARQYADWLPTPEDDTRLPFKQRQRVAERALLHIEPAPGGRTRVSYELRAPVWIYVMSAAITLSIAWISWGVWEYQRGAFFAEWAPRHGINTTWALWNAAVFWIPLAWVATRISKVIRLQNISLLDNVISTFGQMTSKNE